MTQDRRVRPSSVDDDTQQEVVDRLNDALFNLVELEARLPDDDGLDETGARRSYERVLTAVRSALSLLDPEFAGQGEATS